MERSLQLPLQQHPNFAAAICKLGGTAFAVDLEGAAPILTISRFGIRFASRGPVWTDRPDVAMASGLRKSGLHLINSNGGDEDVLRNAGYWRIFPPQHMAELSVTGTHEDRLKRLKGKWRNALRRALKSSQIIQRENFCLMRHQWLLKADEIQQKAKKYRGLPHSFVQAYAAANPDDAIVFVAYSGRDPIAAMLFLVHGAVATYHIGWTSAEGRKKASHNALLMRAGEDLAIRGVERFDLGSTASPGLARFKVGSGARIQTLGGTWLRLPSLKWRSLRATID